MLLNNNVEMPELGLGVYKMTDEQMEDAIAAALEVGYRAFDTAHFYFNEEALGHTLKKSGVPREELFITTKLWNDDQGYQSTLDAFNNSLEKLQLDYLDLYLIHWPCPENNLFIETYKAMEELYHAGKVKAIGVCNFKESHLEQLLKSTNVVPVTNQIEYHPFFQQDELQQFCEEKGIKVTAWSPLMRGGELLKNDVLQQIASNHHKSVAQVVIRWHIQEGRIVIPKSSNPERIKQNIDVFNFELSIEEMNMIKKLNKNERQFRDPDVVKIGDMK